MSAENLHIGIDDPLALNQQMIPTIALLIKCLKIREQIAGQRLPITAYIFRSPLLGFKSKNSSIFC